MAKFSKLSLIGLGVLAAARAAAADPPVYETTTAPPDVPEYDSYAWNEPRMQTGIGVGFILGGGIAGYTDQSMRNVLTSSVAGLWEARVSLGTHIPLGIDVSYLGQASDMKTLTGQNNGTLVGSTFEGALRYNILPHADVNPYIFAGVGWQRYDLQSMVFATSDTGIKATDNLVEFPMGAGISYRDLSGLLVDLRGTFRAAPNASLVTEPNGVPASAHWWEASGAIGYEF